MREYTKVSPRLYTGDLGLSLRGQPFAQELANYLISGPHANMAGIYHLPLEYAAADLGWPLEAPSDGPCYPPYDGASDPPLYGVKDAMRVLVKNNLVMYDDHTRTVWVIEAMRHEIGPTIKSGDTRVVAIRKILVPFIKSSIFNNFRERYAEGFAPCFEGIGLPSDDGALHGGSDAPSDGPPDARKQKAESRKQKAEPQSLRGHGSSKGMKIDVLGKAEAKHTPTSARAREAGEDTKNAEDGGASRGFINSREFWIPFSGKAPAQRKTRKSPGNPKREEVLLLPEEISAVVTAYPNVDFLAEYEKIYEWNCDNENQPKPVRGIRGHLRSWLQDASDRKNGNGKYHRKTEKDKICQPSPRTAQMRRELLR